MTKRSKRLVKKARHIMHQCGLSERYYDDIYLVDHDGIASIHVARFKPTKNNAIYLKAEAKFLRAAKAFKAETGVDLVKIW